MSDMNQGSETRDVGDLENHEAEGLIAYLQKIRDKSSTLAAQGVGGAHEIYVLARNGLDLMVEDQLNRQIMQKLSQPDTSLPHISVMTRGFRNLAG